MDAAELEATIARLDDMRARCDAVIARDRPLQPDRTVGRKRLRSDYVPAVPAVVASGPLVGREMRVRRGYRPQNVEFRGDPARSREIPQDGSIESIFADFEARFDEMRQAHRG